MQRYFNPYRTYVKKGVWLNCIKPRRPNRLSKLGLSDYQKIPIANVANNNPVI